MARSTATSSSKTQVHQSLFKKFQKLENDRQALYDTIKHIDNDELNKKPASGKWSPLQVIDHLRQAESMGLDYIQKKRENPDQVENVKMIGWLRLTLLDAALKLPVKYKAPALFQESAHELDKNELLNEWVKVRQGLSHVVNDITPEEAQKGLFKHPAVGKLNLLQALSFMTIHQHRHKKQIEQMLE